MILVNLHICQGLEMRSRSEGGGGISAIGPKIGAPAVVAEEAEAVAALNERDP